MIFKTYKYRIYPNSIQKELIHKHIGCARWIYNYALEKKNKFYQETKKGLSRFDIQKDLPLLKKDEKTSFLKEVNSQTLQSSLEHLDSAFTKFFKKQGGYPKFKSKKNNKQSFGIQQSTYIDFENVFTSSTKALKKLQKSLHIAATTHHDKLMNIFVTTGASIFDFKKLVCIRKNKKMECKKSLLN